MKPNTTFYQNQTKFSGIKGFKRVLNSSLAMILVYLK
jgi:hypothetical protein